MNKSPLPTNTRVLATRRIHVHIRPDQYEVLQKLMVKHHFETTASALRFVIDEHLRHSPLPAEPAP